MKITIGHPNEYGHRRLKVDGRPAATVQEDWQGARGAYPKHLLVVASLEADGKTILPAARLLYLWDGPLVFDGKTTLREIKNSLVRRVAQRTRRERATITRSVELQASELFRLLAD